jgi:soluble lytic murein transglycosylase-like protein
MPVAACTAQAPATSQAEVRAAVERSAAAQRSAAALMRTSIARQRAAVVAAVGAVAAQRAAIRLQPTPPPRETDGWSAEATTAADCPPMDTEELESVLKEAADKEGLTPDLLRAVVERESGFCPCAVSPKGALGLMQLMPETAELLGVRDAFDPKQNVESGAKFLAGLLERYGGELPLALAAYNAGPGKVDERRKVPEIPETKAFVARVLASLGRM